MRKIAILVPKGEVMPSAVVGAYLLFKQVNEQLAGMGLPEAFDVELVGYAANTRLYDGAFSVKTHRHYTRATGYDLIIVPGFICDMAAPLRENTGLIRWMHRQYVEHGSELGSMCTGVFLVAATGLLDGKKCTTHWAFEQAFRQTFPNANLQPEHIVIDDKGLYSSGGAYSSLNLILYLVEKFCGKDMAVWASKVFQIDLDRKSQKRFAIFQQQKMHVDNSVAEAQEYIEQHYAEPLTVQALANRFTFSRRNFIRRFKEATSNTPIAYIQRVRIEAAKRLLEGSTKSIGAIMLETGYNDNKTFRATFKKYTGYAPSVYRSRYQRV
jgi:transcriptional regulator GlxA family with amidase domain